MVHKTKGKAEKNGGQSCKQGEKCDVSGQSVMVEDQLPDVRFISTENLVHNTGIVGGVGDQFDAELLSGIFMGGGAKMKRLAEFFPIRRVLLVLYCSLKVPFMYMFTSCREERIAIDEASKSAGRVDVMTMVSPAGTS